MQREAMEAVLAARDSLVVLPTGGGKSLCFQVPALTGDGLAVVVSPLIALMKDQVDTLVGNGVPAAGYHSGMTADAKQTVAAASARVATVCCTWRPSGSWARGAELPRAGRSRGRPVPRDRRGALHQPVGPRLPARNTASWRDLRDRWPQLSLHAFTATATARVRRDIVSQLGLREPVELVGSFDRPNLVYRVLTRAASEEAAAGHPRRAIGARPASSTASRGREVDALAAWLPRDGVRARAVSRGAGRR